MTIYLGSKKVGAGIVVYSQPTTTVENRKQYGVYCDNNGLFGYEIYPDTYADESKYYPELIPQMINGQAGNPTGAYGLGVDYYVRSKGATNLDVFMDVNNIDSVQFYLIYGITQLPTVDGTYVSLLSTSQSLGVRHNLRLKYNPSEDIAYYQLVLIDETVSPAVETICLEAPLPNASTYVGHWMNVALFKQDSSWVLWNGLNMQQGYYDNLVLDTASDSIFICSGHGKDGNMTDETGYFEFAVDLALTQIHNVWSAATSYDAMRSVYLTLDVNVPSTSGEGTTYPISAPHHYDTSDLSVGDSVLFLFHEANIVNNEISYIEIFKNDVYLSKNEAKRMYSGIITGIDDTVIHLEANLGKVITLQIDTTDYDSVTIKGVSL